MPLLLQRSSWHTLPPVASGDSQEPAHWRPTMCSLGGACSLLSETHRVLGHVWTKGEWLSSYQAPDALQVYFLNSTRKQNLSA